MTQPARFSQADIERAVKAVRKAGFKNGTVEVDRLGNIKINFGNGATGAQRNPWDDE
jgi:hypothetical protein